MNIEHYKEVEAIFVEVIDLPKEQRSRKIGQLTKNQTIINSVQQLLDEHERLSSDEFMELDLLGDTIKLDQSGHNTPNPSVINRYSVIRVLGRGTSGTVYLAKSPPPLERAVALKLIHTGSSENSVIRFQEEQRILAKLKNKGIAQVYDEGISECGRPYTVMEYIDGMSITEYCSSHRLKWPAVIELIIQCCDAIIHAHEHDIIHRDLKPSNLLVTRVNDETQIKVIDFGTAIILDRHPRITQFSMGSKFIGTLSYSSPEQILGSNLPDKRSDLYALGIVLFECLEGNHPFLESGLGFKAILDRILTKPIPGLRQKHGAPVCELNAIISKSCAKEPNQRYSSLALLSKDLQNLLEGLPVQAVKSRRVYVAQKFLRRHRVPLSVVVFVFAMLATVVGIGITQRIHANSQRNALRESTFFMVDQLMPMLADLSGSTPAKKELAYTLHKQIDELLVANPTDPELLHHKAYILEYESDMALSDGQIEQSQGLRHESIRIIESLLDSRNVEDQTLSRDHRRLIIKLGDIEKALKNYEFARKYYNEAHELILASQEDQRATLCWSLERLSWIAYKQGEYPFAEELAQQRMDLSEILLNEQPDSPMLLRNCATAHQILAELNSISENYDVSLRHARSSSTFAKRLLLVDPDSYLSQEMQLHSAVELIRSLVHNDLKYQALAEANQVVLLSRELVNRNPNRKDVLDIAWNKLRAIYYTFSQEYTSQNLSFLENAMKSMIPGRPY